MPKKLEELTGVFSRVRIRFDDDTIVGTLDDRTAVKGRSPETDDGLTPGMTYRFYGRWEEYHNKRLNQKQRQFSFRQYVKCEPHTRHGLVKYLQRYARGIGPARAGRMFDLYGSDAVKMLRTDPGRVVNDVKGLKVADAQAAAETLQGLAELEDTKIALWSLLAGRGFPANLADEVIQRWGILAPARIKRDPLSLLVENFAGCGWNRVDALYCELGHDPARLKRQMLCAWYTVHSDSSGHTWHPVAVLVHGINQNIAGAQVNARRAITLGLRAGWLAKRKGRDGKWYFAERKKAENEAVLAAKVRELMEWKPGDATS